MTMDSRGVARDVLRILRAREAIHADILRKAVFAARRRHRLPLPGEMTPDFDRHEDFLQVIHAICTVMEEAIAGVETTARTSLLESSAEGLLRAGIPPFPYQAHVVAAWEAGFVADVIPRLPESGRVIAAEWLMHFFADYMSDVIDISLRLTRAETP